MEEIRQNKVKLFVICGYLGAGKTTFIKHIIKTTTKKIAFIQNEFADEMGIESPLIKNSDGTVFDKIYELPNGCLCCSAKTELTRAVEYFIEMNTDIEYIIIETNGLADPSATMKLFWIDEQMNFPGLLQAVISIIPTHKFEKLMENELFLRQIIYADLILLNHQDLVSTQMKIDILGQIKKVNPVAQSVETTYAEFDANELLKIEGFNSYGFLSGEGGKKIPEKGIHAESDVQFFVLDFGQKSFDFHALEQKIGLLLWENPFGMEILRIKGNVKINSNKWLHHIQGVEEIFEIKPSEDEWNATKHTGRMLFVGKKMSKQTLMDFICAELESNQQLINYQTNFLFNLTPKI